MNNPNNTALDGTPLLAELIGQKLGILQQVQQLTQMQAEAISKSELQRLMKILAAKTRLLRGLEAIGVQLRPFHADDPEERSWDSPQARADCRRDSDRCKEILVEVMLSEQQCEKDLAEKRDLTAARIDAAHCAAQARQAYAGKVVARPQLDISSD
jgi:hypothetical protein